MTGRRTSHFRAVYRRHSYQYNSVLFGILVAGSLLAALLATGVPFLLAWLAALSGTTLMLFGLDKAMAKMNRPRIPEIVLHLFTIAGGFPGQIAGRYLFRHKINRQLHASFDRVFAVALALFAAIVYLVMVAS